MAAAGEATRAPRTVADATHDLYRQYGKQIYAYCLHQLRSREEAEDAVQTTFLNAFRGLQRGTTTSFEQAWLYKIAQNVCIARRSSSGRRLRLEAPGDLEVLEEIVPSGTLPTDTLELMGLDAALEQMPENQRRAILLREWQGLSYREIAEELELSQGAVEMLIFRARRTLATALEQPDVLAKRRTGKVRTGFSFGSLIAALKSTFSTGAAIKLAAVAVTATVVGTNAVRTVVQQVTPHSTTPKSIVTPVRRSSVTSVVVPTVALTPARTVAKKAHHARTPVVKHAVWAGTPTIASKPALAPDVASTPAQPAVASTPTATQPSEGTSASAPVQSAPAPNVGSTSSPAASQGAAGQAAAGGTASPSDTATSGNSGMATSTSGSTDGSTTTPSGLTTTGTTARHDGRGGNGGAVTSTSSSDSSTSTTDSTSSSSTPPDSSSNSPAIPPTSGAPSP
jgi:RNA polymerase sigma factor (sigma-70 family)